MSEPHTRTTHAAQAADVLQRGPSVGDAQMYLQGVQGQSTRDDASG